MKRRNDEYVREIIGTWNSPLSLLWYKGEHITTPSFLFTVRCKYWEIELRKLKMRIWKPKFLGCN